jgi:hypothetical protein
MSDRLEVVMGQRERDGKRAVIAMLGKNQQVDKFDPLSEFHRRRFREHVITRFQLGDDGVMEWIDELLDIGNKLAHCAHVKRSTVECALSMAHSLLDGSPYLVQPIAAGRLS